MNKKEIVKEYAKNHNYFSLSQIAKETALSKEIVKVYLSHLKREKTVFTAGHGVYSSIKSVFQLVADNRTYTLLKHLKKNFPYTDFLIWNTRQLQPLYHHTQQHHITFIDVEKDSVLSFYEIISKEYRGAIIEKRSQSYYNSIDIARSPVVIRNLTSRSSKSKDNHIPRIEKVLGDIFLDIDKYKYISSSDYWNIWKEMYLRYRIDMGFLYNYVKRRKCLEDIFPKIIYLYRDYRLTFAAYFKKVAKVNS